MTYQVAHRSLAEIWGLLGNIDVVHGLYYLVMHVVFGVWDGGLVALRLPSVMATAAAAAGVAAIAHRLVGARAALLSGLVFSLLPAVQHYAQEGRSYALVCAAVTWATYLLLRGVAGNRARTWAAYGVTVLVASWLHEFAALALAAHGVTLMWSGVSRAVWRSWGLAVGAVAAGVLPLAAVSAGQAGQQLGWLGNPGWGEWGMFLGMSAVGWLCARVPFRSLRSLRSLRSSRSSGSVRLAALALPLLVVPAGLLLAVSVVKPWYVDRYVLYGLAGPALLVGSWLDWLLSPEGTRRFVPRRSLRRAAACVFVTSLVAVLLPWSLMMRSPESRKDDVVAVAEAVREAAAPGDSVLFMPARRREWLLSCPGTYRDLRDLALARSPAASHTLQGTELPAEEIRHRILAADRVIALMDPAGQPLDMIEQEVVKRETLSDHFLLCEQNRVRGARIAVYARVGHCGQGGQRGKEPGKAVMPPEIP